MLQPILCTLAVSYVSAASVSADNSGVNKATVLPSSFVISGTHNTSISGTYNQISYVCNGLPVYQKGGSDGLVLFQQDGFKYWHVGSAAQATNASGPPGTTNCGYMDPIYLDSQGFCGASPAGAGCANQWKEFPAGYGIPDPDDCRIDPADCINPAVKIQPAGSVAANVYNPHNIAQVHWSWDVSSEGGNMAVNRLQSCFRIGKGNGNVTIVAGSGGVYGQLVASCEGYHDSYPISLYCQVTVTAATSASASGTTTSSAGALSLQAHYTVTDVDAPALYDDGPVVQSGCSTIMISGKPYPDGGQCCFI